MSRTVSFRCSEELDKLLEEEAERRMTTKSTVAQMIVAEHFREQTEQATEETEDTEENGESPEENEEATTEEVGGESQLSENEKLLEKHSEHWYESDGEKNNYAVEPPEDSGGKRRYYKSQEGAAKRLAEWYE